jgi:hypothetical protein
MASADYSCVSLDCEFAVMKMGPQHATIFQTLSCVSCLGVLVFGSPDQSRR